MARFIGGVMHGKVVEVPDEETTFAVELLDVDWRTVNWEDPPRDFTKLPTKKHTYIRQVHLPTNQYFFYSGIDGQSIESLKLDGYWPDEDDWMDI